MCSFMPLKMEIVKEHLLMNQSAYKNVFLSKILNNRPITFLLSDRRR